MPNIDSQILSDRARTELASQQIKQAADNAVASIGDIETDTIEAINTVRDNGISAVQSARDQGVGAVQSARDSAISNINALVTQAETVRDETQSIKDSIEWKGVYDASTTYAKDNRVSYQGSSFISLQDSNTGNTPVGNEADTWWDVIAEKGDQGIQGETGPQGEQGPQGPKGDTGDFSLTENVNALGSITGATTIDLSLGTVITATLTGAITLSFTGLPSANQVYAFTLQFSGVQEITYPAGTLFAGGSAPSIVGPNYEIPCSINSAGTLRVYGVIDEVA